MTLIDKSSFAAIGHARIDADHEEFIALVNQLHTASNAEFPALFEQLQQHTTAHFERESQLMQQFAYPGAGEHNSEHQRVLHEFKQFKTQVDKGMLAFGRAFVRERLPQWFALHVSMMDTALVVFLNAQPKA